MTESMFSPEESVTLLQVWGKGKLHTEEHCSSLRRWQDTPQPRSVVWGELQSKHLCCTCAHAVADLRSTWATRESQVESGEVILADRAQWLRAGARGVLQEILSRCAVSLWEGRYVSVYRCSDVMAKWLVEYSLTTRSADRFAFSVVESGDPTFLGQVWDRACVGFEPEPFLGDVVEEVEKMLSTESAHPGAKEIFLKLWEEGLSLPRAVDAAVHILS